MIVKIIILITFKVFAFNFNEGFNFLYLCFRFHGKVQEEMKNTTLTMKV